VNKLFRPGSVAVVGPSSSAERAGNIILKNLKTFGYPGAVYPVNPSGAQIEGLQSYPTIAACPKSPELAVLAVPYSQVGKVMSDVAAAGTRHAIVVSGGFSDAGAEGKVREKGLLEFCRKNGINLMGPNSIGTFDAVYGFCTAIGKLPAMKASGISMLGQSGMLSTGFPLEEITVRGRGFSKIACMGNKADIDECDLLRYFADDPDTRVIGAYIEGVGDGPRFRRSAEFAARKKPLVILKSGRTELGARAAASHTGALSGADDVYNAIFKQSGAQRVAGFSEFFGILRTFDLCPLPRGNRIGVVSITGMGCVLSADACSDYGMQLAPITEGTREKLRSLAPGWASITNPADIWSTIEQRGPFEAYLKLSEAMISDENVDILLVIAMLLEEGAFDARASFEAVRKAHPDKPILACIFGGRKDLMESFSSGLESIGVPVFYEPGEAIKASSYLYKRRLIQGRNGV
jgi:acetyltransferase